MARKKGKAGLSSRSFLFFAPFFFFFSPFRLSLPPLSAPRSTRMGYFRCQIFFHSTRNTETRNHPKNRSKPQTQYGPNARWLFTRYDWVIRDLTELWQRRHRKRLKNNSLVSNTTTLHVNHAFLFISLPFLHNYDVIWPILKSNWERQRQGDKFHYFLRGPLSSVTA